MKFSKKILIILSTFLTPILFIDNFNVLNNKKEQKSTDETWITPTYTIDKFVLGQQGTMGYFLNDYDQTQFKIDSISVNSFGNFTGGVKFSLGNYSDSQATVAFDSYNHTSYEIGYFFGSIGDINFCEYSYLYEQGTKTSKSLTTKYYINGNLYLPTISGSQSYTPSTNSYVKITFFSGPFINWNIKDKYDLFQVTLDIKPLISQPIINSVVTDQGTDLYGKTKTITSIDIDWNTVSNDANAFAILVYKGDKSLLNGEISSTIDNNNLIYADSENSIEQLTSSGIILGDKITEQKGTTISRYYIW